MSTLLAVACPLLGLAGIGACACYSLVLDIEHAWRTLRVTP